MAAIQRTGIYGSYVGSPSGSSEPLSEEQMQVNAIYIRTSLRAQGWTDNSIAALLGNMQAESSINPGRWQNDSIGSEPLGYGLVQWTPSNKYTSWSNSQGYSDASEMDSNLARIVYEVQNNVQWIATGSFSNMSFLEFAKSNRSPHVLAIAFLLCYERPADQSEEVQAKRGSMADAWYTYLTGNPTPPDIPDTPGGTTTKKKKKYNFLLFNRRNKQWISRNY